MNPDIPFSGRPGESPDQLPGSVLDRAGQLARRIGQDEIGVRPRRTLQEAQHPAATSWAALSPAASQPVPALVSRAASGDREAWNEIVDRYAPLAYAICRRHGLAGHDIQDAAQQVWRQLAERIGTLHEPAALPGWLATTTNRECLRVLTRRADQLDVPPQNPAQLADDATTGAEIFIAEQNAAIRTAFADLPPRCQQLLSMLVSDPPHSYAEISAAMHVRVGSIGALQGRCLGRLRQTITSVAPTTGTSRPGP